MVQKVWSVNKCHAINKWVGEPGKHVNHCCITKPQTKVGVPWTSKPEQENKMNKPHN
jgi:hypothetical protein